MTYKLCLKLIDAGKTTGLADKIDIYFAANRLTEEEYTILMEKLNGDTAKSTPETLS